MCLLLSSGANTLLKSTLREQAKGVVVEKLLSTMAGTNKTPDFILYIGDDRPDEDACTIGKKPSMARYYLDDPVDVVNMMQGLAHVLVSHWPKVEFPCPISFEGSL